MQAGASHARAGAPLPASGRHLVVVGCGGNIGSHLVSHLGRMAGVSDVTLIDRDKYEPKNLLSQDILPGDVGRPKAAVQARRLRRINPGLHVRAIPRSIEELPLGLFRGDAILACLDTARARQTTNEAAWRLGVPWIDAGVEAGQFLARVNVYVPADGASCIECAWDKRHYDALEQVYACPAGVAAASPTNAPSSLGALVAALEAIECAKLLSGQGESALAGRQLVLSAREYRLHVMSVRRNPRCRAPHRIWQIRQLAEGPEDLTLAAAFELASGDPRSLSLRVAGSRFTRALTCARCEKIRPALRATRGFTPLGRCLDCGGDLVARGFDLQERLSGSDLSTAGRSRTLGSLGLRPRDVIVIENGGNGGDSECFELGPLQ